MMYIQEFAKNISTYYFTYPDKNYNYIFYNKTETLNNYPIDLYFSVVNYVLFYSILISLLYNLVYSALYLLPSIYKYLQFQNYVNNASKSLFTDIFYYLNKIKNNLYINQNSNPIEIYTILFDILTKYSSNTDTKTNKTNTSCATDCKTQCATDCKTQCATDCKTQCATDCKSPCVKDCKSPYVTDCKSPCVKDCKSPCVKDCKSPCVKDCKSPCVKDCKSPCVKNKVICENISNDKFDLYNSDESDKSYVIPNVLCDEDKKDKCNEDKKDKCDEDKKDKCDEDIHNFNYLIVNNEQIILDNKAKLKPLTDDELVRNLLSIKDKYNGTNNNEYIISVYLNLLNIFKNVDKCLIKKHCKNSTIKHFISLYKFVDKKEKNLNKIDLIICLFNTYSIKYNKYKYNKSLSFSIIETYYTYCVEKINETFTNIDTDDVDQFINSVKFLNFSKLHIRKNIVMTR